MAAGAKLVGGCCTTMPEDIAGLAAAVKKVYTAF
ncbi:homocysteine S-methyltransferase family protein [Lactobacillus delbrueckii]